jgi:hypothetical protein
LEVAWKVFVEAYAGADSALMRSGKLPSVLANDTFPDRVKRWAENPDSTMDYQDGDHASWEAEMLQVWNPIHSSITAATNPTSIDTLLDQDWCRRGRGGLVCFVVGMKWWRTSLTASENEVSFNSWRTLLSEMTAAFKVISSAGSL